MKKLVLICFLLIGFASIGFAQKPPTAEEISRKNVEELDERLKLSSTQKAVFTRYYYDMVKAQQETIKRQKTNGYNDEEVTLYYKMMNEMNDKLRAVLKPEQVTEFNKILEERLAGVDTNKKKKKGKKDKEEEKIVGIEGLKKVNNP